MPKRRQPARTLTPPSWFKAFSYTTVLLAGATGGLLAAYLLGPASAILGAGLFAGMAMGIVFGKEMRGGPFVATMTIIVLYGAVGALRHLVQGPHAPATSLVMFSWAVGGLIPFFGVFWGDWAFTTLVRYRR